MAGLVQVGHVAAVQHVDAWLEAYEGGISAGVIHTTHVNASYPKPWLTDPYVLAPHASAALRADYVPVKGAKRAYMPPNEEWEQHWRPLDLSPASPYAVEADLAPLGDAPIYAVRYAWGVKTAASSEPLCCGDPAEEPRLGRTLPCREGLCPIVASGGLPANPFIARIVDGRCKCIPPQVCD